VSRLDDFLQRSGRWLSTGHETGTVVSSRIRLARNLRNSAFPGWAGEAECERIWAEMEPVLTGLKSLTPSLSVPMGELDELGRQILFERHLISREHAEKGKGSGLVVREDEAVSVMVNEEDHLRLQALRPGLDLQGAWQAINRMDSEIEAHVDYSFSPRLGYLTACPTNVGTGMRASVMLHLPGLHLMNEMNPVIKGMSKIGLAVRGLWGEGTEAAGNMFQISNQMTLGEKEEDIISNIEQIVLEIMDHEKNARLRLVERREVFAKDHVGRSYGILCHAHILTSKEALDLLSGLRLGIDLGILKQVERGVVDELFIMTQPGHLQRMEHKLLKPRDRDRLRARLVRSRLMGKATGGDRERDSDE
jgi:protein arginine kinase